MTTKRHPKKFFWVGGSAHVEKDAIITSRIERLARWNGLAVVPSDTRKATDQNAGQSIAARPTRERFGKGLAIEMRKHQDATQLKSDCWSCPLQANCNRCSHPHTSRLNICEHQRLLFEHCHDEAVCNNSLDKLGQDRQAALSPSTLKTKIAIQKLRFPSGFQAPRMLEK